MIKQTILCAAVASLISVGAFAQSEQLTYNVQAASESYRKGNYKDAANYLYRELQENPENGLAYLYFGNMDEEYRYYGEALRNYENAMRYLPSNDKQHIIEAKNCFVKALMDVGGQPELCLEIANEAVKMDKSDQSIMRRASLVYLDASVAQYDKAIADLKKVIKKGDPESLRLAHPILALTYMRKGDKESALASLNDALKLTPDDYYSLSLRARYYYANGQYELSAKDAYRNYLKNDYSADDLALSVLPQVAYEVVKSALEDVIKTCDVNADNADILRFTAALYASNCPDIVKYINSVDDSYQSFLGFAYVELGAYGKALEVLTSVAAKAEEKGETDAFALSEMGDAYCRMGDFAAAREQYRKAINVRPDFSSYYVNMENLNYLEGNYEEAAAYADTVIVLSPDDYHMMGNKARLYLLMDKQKEARDLANDIILHEAEYLRTNNAKDMFETPYIKRVPHGSVLAYAVLGDKQKVDECVSEITAVYKRGFDWFYATVAYAMTDQLDKALDALSKAFDAGYVDFLTLERAPELANLRQADGYTELIEKARTAHLERLQNLN